MKKLFTLVALAMIAMGANAQRIAEKDWDGGFDGDYPMWYQFADGQDGSVASNEDGVAITVGSQTGELWQPQVQVLSGDLTLEEDHSYVVKVTALFPTDGTLQINMGSWDGRDQYTVPVIAGEDFQNVYVEFPDYAYNVAGNGFVLFQCGDFLGTSIVKKVMVIDLDASGEATGIKNLKNNTQSVVRYNLAGQQVDANFKGIVIQNGKKFMQK